MNKSLKSLITYLATFSFVLMLGMAYGQEASTKYVEAQKQLAELKNVDKSRLTSNEKKVLKAEIKAVKKVISIEEDKMLAEAGLSRRNSPYGSPYFDRFGRPYYGSAFYNPYVYRQPVVVVRRSRRECRVRPNN